MRADADESFSTSRVCLHVDDASVGPDASFVRRSVNSGVYRRVRQ